MDRKGQGMNKSKTALDENILTVKHQLSKHQ